MKIVLDLGDYEKIITCAKSQAPNEACGLVAGSDNGDLRRIEKIYMLTNLDNSPEHFSLSPREQLEAVRDMRTLGIKLLGNWHSHPASPSRPSVEDMRLAFDRSLSYLIISLMDKERPVLKSFHIENFAYIEEEIMFTGGNN